MHWNHSRIIFECWVFSKCWPVLVFVHHTILIICITCRKFRIHVRYKNFKQCVFSLISMFIWLFGQPQYTIERLKFDAMEVQVAQINYFLPENNDFFLYWHLHNSRSSQVFHVLCFPHDSMHCISRSYT